MIVSSLRELSLLETFIDKKSEVNNIADNEILNVQTND